METNSNGNGKDYERYRLNKMESAAVYQDFVVDVCWNLLGLAIVMYTSKAYQIHVGESKTGAEIKHDEKYAQTGNLWIECAEKARPREGGYFPAGIFRGDNSWLYIIGDYDTIYIFPKTILQALAECGRYPIKENRTLTSQGFLLRKKDAEKYAAQVLRPNAAQKVTKAIKDLEAYGRELHAIVKQDSRQCSLFDSGDDNGNGGDPILSAIDR